MIKDNQKYFNRMHVIIDAIVVVVSYFLAWVARYVWPFAEDVVRAVPFEWYMRLLPVIVPVYLVLYYAFNLYTPKRVQGRRLEFSNVIKANTVGILLLICFISILLKENNLSRRMFFYF